MKSSLFKDAPPTNTPSTFGIDIMSAALPALTDAPYRIGVPANPISHNVFAINACASAISAAVGVNPAPIAQRGSYAIITFLTCSLDSVVNTNNILFISILLLYFNMLFFKDNNEKVFNQFIAQEPNLLLIEDV